MKIRDYKSSDKRKWLECRVLSFLDCSYYNDVWVERKLYKNKAICLVAEENGRIIGLLDIEMEEEIGSLCVAGKQRGAVIWNLAVLPEFRRKCVASLLWKEGKRRLKEAGIQYCEVWTQEDPAANTWYLSQGFCNVKEWNWLRCYANSSSMDWFLNRKNMGELYGVEEIRFQVAALRRQEVSAYCYKIDEVRLYAREL